MAAGLGRYCLSPAAELPRHLAQKEQSKSAAEAVVESRLGLLALLPN